MTPREILIEWRRGCSNSKLGGQPEDCEECTAAAIAALRKALAPKPCPSCGQLKEGDGLPCAYCSRERRIQIEEDRKL